MPGQDFRRVLGGRVVEVAGAVAAESEVPER